MTTKPDTNTIGRRDHDPVIQRLAELERHIQSVRAEFYSGDLTGVFKDTTLDGGAVCVIIDAMNDASKAIASLVGRRVIQMYRS